MNKTILFVVSFFVVFCLLADRPLTAQLPGSDKPAEKAEVKKQEPKPTKVRLGDDEINVEEVRAKYYIGVEIGSETRRETFEGREVERKISKKAYGQPNAGYFIKVENHLVEPVCEECESVDEEKSKFELYTTDGNKVFENEFKGKRILEAVVLKTGVFMIKTASADNSVMSSVEQYEIYNNKGKLLHEFKNIKNFATSPQVDYLLLLKKTGEDEVILEKLDLHGNLKILTKMLGTTWLQVQGISDNGFYFLITDVKEVAKTAPSGNKYRAMDIMYFGNDKLIRTKTLEAAGFSWSTLSQKGKYVIIVYSADHAFKEITDGTRTYKIYSKFVERLKVIKASSWETIHDGLKDEKLITEYKNETINN